MEKITIKIPDGLTAQQELMEIAKHLGRKLLPPQASRKQLGTGYHITHLQTEITITREPIKSPIVTRECSICNTLFAKNAGKILWINYGGEQRARHYCSTRCRSIVLQYVGEGRAAIRKQDLGLIRSYN